MLTLELKGETPQELFDAVLKLADTLRPAHVPKTIPAETKPASVETPAPVPTVPISAKTYTLEELARAGADLAQAQADKVPALVALLQQCGATQIADVKPERYNDLAHGLIELGAKL